MKKTPDKRRQKAYKRGYWAEYKAAIALIFKGYRIIAMRYKTHGGEIDIIAKKSDLIIMIEVKARHNLAACIDAVTTENMRRIHAASDVWISKQKHGERYSIRYDIMAIVPWKWPAHYLNAF